MIYNFLLLFQLSTKSISWIENPDHSRSTLFLWGQYLDVLAYEKQFPNTEFVITRRSDTRYLMDIEVRGDYFEPEKVLPPFDDEKWKSGKYPKDGDLLRIEIENVT